MSRYRRASFGLTIGSIEYRQRVVRGVTGSVRYQYERRAYNDDFRERNSDTHEVGVGGSWNPRGSRFDLEAAAGYRASAAAGSDGDEAAGAASDDADPSYHGIVLSGQARVTLSRAVAGRLQGEVGGEFQRRDYTTDRATDTSHFDRTDRIADLILGLRWNPKGPFSFRVFYRRENDDATFSSASPPATDPASYGANQFGASVEFGSTLWKR